MSVGHTGYDFVEETHIDEVCLVAHVQIVNDRGLVQMCEFSHIASLVELGRVDFVDSIFSDFLLRAIVALDKQCAALLFLDNPPANEGSLGITKPDISLARKVVFALDDAGGLGRVGVILGDELGREGSDRGAEAM